MLSLVKKHWLDYALLLVLSTTVYGQILSHDFLYNWDDHVYVLENLAVQGFSWEHIKTLFSSYYLGNYAPVHLLSYMLDFELWGLNASGFLFTNLLFHTLNAFLLYRLFLRCHQDPLMARVAAAVFIAHPVQVETVAWVSERKNLLAMLLFLLAWEWYLKYSDSDGVKARRFYCLSLAAFSAALLAKSIVVILPVLLVVFGFCFPTNRRRPDVIATLPFFFAATIAGVVALYSQQSVVTGTPLAGYHGGSPLATFYTMLPVLCRYIGMIFWPAGLSITYAPPIRTTFDLTTFAALSLLICLAIGGIKLFRVDRRFAFWSALIFVGILPVAQIIPIPTLINDRYLYFPMIGIAGLVGGLSSYLRQKVGQKNNFVLWLLIGLPLLSLSVASFNRCKAWHDASSLWRAAVKESPTSAVAWAGLGEIYLRDGEKAKAIAAFEKSLVLNPKHLMSMNNLASIYVENTELERGLDLAQRVVAADPLFPFGWANMGKYYHKKGEFAEAERLYKHALSLSPATMQLHFGLGMLFLQQQRYEEAIECLLAADKLVRGDSEIAYDLAVANSRAGRVDDAVGWLETSILRGNMDVNAIITDPGLTEVRQRRQRQVASLLQKHITPGTR